MLNELVTIERGMRDVLETSERHPDVKVLPSGGGKPTLIVDLDVNGHLAAVRPLPQEVKPWTLRDGQHNSFPFVQPASPLWEIPKETRADRKQERPQTSRTIDRRQAVYDTRPRASFQVEAFADWPSTGLQHRLLQRRQQLTSFSGTKAEPVLACIDRFLLACGTSRRSQTPHILFEVAEAIVMELDKSSQNDWSEVAYALLIGSLDKRTGQRRCTGALLFNASGNTTPIFDAGLCTSVSNALREIPQPMGEGGFCAISGTHAKLLMGNFPQPNLPVLGQTFLYAKNREIPANDRYHRFSVESMPVGEATAIGLAAALEAITAPDRRNITWRSLPSETPGKSDLLLAFAQAVPDAPVAESFAEDDFSKEAPDAVSALADSVASYEKRTLRLIQLIKAKSTADVTQTPVQVAVLRKVDQANRKVAYMGTLTVETLHRAATSWIRAERNVPPWLSLPVLRKNERGPRPTLPPHIAPLGFIAFTKQMYVLGGTEHQEAVGLPAGEAMRLFLDSTPAAAGRARRLLHLVLSRRATLLAGVAQLQHSPRSWGRRPEVTKKLDHTEALRTVTALGLVLHKLGRVKEVYVNEAAFKLGQLLAAADAIHAGYCADVRAGEVPPALLGNQVFGMAQASPTKALATLCRRWRPYDGWAKKAARESDRIDKLCVSEAKSEQRRGWDIRVALSQARKMAPLAAELDTVLGSCHVDDVFRAELLLGYVAGLPRSQREETDEPDANPKEGK